MTLGRKLGFMMWATAALVLSAALTWRAVDAHSANAELFRKISSEESELDRRNSERVRLKAELDALENDPMYIEQALRCMRHAESGERIVEPKKQERRGKTPGRGAR
ncbi:MAG: hypothetical protein HYY16_11460 [Planctomycetes bacterium]|nr:hypothetical protein [Planctomycetota bacterium]